jgi:hypothetical protein
MISPRSLCVRESSHIDFLMAKQLFLACGMYIMSPEPISTAYFLNPSHQSVYLCV